MEGKVSESAAVPGQIELIRFSCPHCQQKLEADRSYADQQINCPACQSSLIVPRSPNVNALASAKLAGNPHASLPPIVSTCPSCGNSLARGAVLCTQCGYNIATGQRMVAGRPAPLGKPNVRKRACPWYKTAAPYLVLLTIVLAGLVAFGRHNRSIMLILALAILLYHLCVHLLVVVAAFHEGAGTGLLALFIPFYALYYVFAVSENETLKLLYSSAVVLQVLLRIVVKW